MPSVSWDRAYVTDDDKMRLVIALARGNVDHETGGPFGAAVFERDGGRLVSVGVNTVVTSHNAMLHAEIVACMLAQARVRSYTLSAPDLPQHDLAASCAPCAMCLGAVLWSGVRRIVYGASRDDAVDCGFDEGPVFPESYTYLTSRGMAFIGDVRRDEARAVLDTYNRRGGTLYNG